MCELERERGGEERGKRGKETIEGGECVSWRGREGGESREGGERKREGERGDWSGSCREQ